MIVLKDILYKVAIEAVKGPTDICINALDFDSRKIVANDVFVAIRGSVSDGHDYIQKAIEMGAVAIVCDTFPEAIASGVTYIQVKDTNAALAFLAANFYGNPSQNLQLVGITGTNGKTTIASLLYQMFKKAGYKVGLLSTVKIMVDETQYKATHTTPDSITINRYLAEMSHERRRVLLYGSELARRTPKAHRSFAVCRRRVYQPLARPFGLPSDVCRIPRCEEVIF
jgi:UDP-N-acetylmuramoyl-L-alanyl-D-glutamate--2,6-diaminopimelate ligase